MKQSFSILILPLFFCLLMTKSFSQKKISASESTDPKWWKEAIVYQIYPRSFQDSDGDGVGDLKGIISRLDYIKSLGINVVWLNPIFASPNDDNGYDISDYRAIMKEFGSMEDFNTLLKGMHKRGIKLVMDLVVNHSSDEHEWFKQSRSSRTSPYRNYYHWWNAERGQPPYRFSQFDVNHNAWKYDSLTNAYYLHYFSQKQPDLNWENPKLRHEIYDIMKFWIAKGIDGFRMDAFQFVAKDTTFPTFPEGYEKDFINYHALVHPIHDYLKEMYREVYSKYDIMSVAEGAGRNFADAHDLVDADRKELNMAYAFEAIDIPKPEGYSLLKLKRAFSKWDSAFAIKGWLSVFLANHDNARMVNRYGNDSREFRELSSKMLTTFILTMRGTPYYYNGDELRMNNIKFSRIEDYRDIATINEYKYQQSIGGDLNKFIEVAKFSSRDNGRTPFQWNGSANAGFTTGTPWLSVNPNYKTINAEVQEHDVKSCLNYFRKATKLRNENKELVYGKYEPTDKENEKVYAFIREQNGKKFLVALNFSKETALYKTGIDMRHAKLLLNNYTKVSQPGHLKPYEAVVYAVAK